MEFSLINLVLSVTTANESALLQRLFRCGAEFSSTCRDIVCRWPVRDCHECSTRHDCTWHRVFGQELTVDPEALKRHQKPPLPFVFTFENPAIASDNPGLVTVRLIVIGKAILCLEMLLKGFSILLEKQTKHIKCEVGEVASVGYHEDAHALGEGCCINFPENLTILSTAGLIEKWPWSCDRIRLIFETPLRLFDKGHILKSFDTGLFIRSLLRRISSLAYYYGENCSEPDFKELSRHVDQISCCDNYFQYQPLWQATNKLSGIVGNGVVYGALNDLMPFIILGSYLHAGKGSSFGMGKYALYTDQ
ncbi:CRISPR system precrRNA processing endoribonuclease RAMP protein Cas6 [Pelotalea chapellei]|uniref:CRISPR system precrRNA processing endoribonuclease RAMP protein Cas6 n=1 Tax=Pelotalea chapellei TaxID=44671 RepID=A0ABS5U715_9BACT|nr:CRISPR system precrRNA processing endoribonuclease RAMP protein Cas6 [Pelotalea chapellei]